MFGLFGKRTAFIGNKPGGSNSGGGGSSDGKLERKDNGTREIPQDGVEYIAPDQSIFGDGKEVLRIYFSAVGNGYTIRTGVDDFHGRVVAWVSTVGSSDRVAGAVTATAVGSGFSALVFLTSIGELKTQENNYTIKKGYVDFSLL